MSQTGQAVRGSHQNELLIRSDTNRSYRHQSVKCKSCLKIITNVLECFVVIRYIDRINYIVYVFCLELFTSAYFNVLNILK